MEFRSVDKNNIWEIVNLSVREDQKSFVSTNTESILAAYTVITSGGLALPCGIYENNTLVGFIMFGYGPVNQKNVEHNYCIWRFMIDKAYQGRGLGRKALKTAIDYVRRKPYGEAKTCWITYEPRNYVAKRLYNSLGFIENGTMYDNTVVAVLMI